MTRAEWAFLCVVALWLGLGVGFLIEGMEWAAVVGTIPTWAFVVAVRIAPRKLPQADKTKEWFI